MNRYKEIEQTKETYRAESPEPGAAWPPKVRRALKCIHQNLFKQKLTVGWMKQQCRISGHNFSSRFVYYLSKTPKRYINHHRMEGAKRLLSNAELSGTPISTVAYELGFSTVSGFSKCFKQNTEMPPSYWHKENGKDKY